MNTKTNKLHIARRINPKTSNNDNRLQMIADAVERIQKSK